ANPGLSLFFLKKISFDDFFWLLQQMNLGEDKMNMHLQKMAELALKILTNITHSRAVKLKEETFQSLFDIFGHFRKHEMVDSLTMCLSVTHNLHVSCFRFCHVGVYNVLLITHIKQIKHKKGINGVDALQHMVEYYLQLSHSIHDIETAENSHAIVASDCHAYSSKKLLLFSLALLLGLLLQDAMQSKRIWQLLLELSQKKSRLCLVSQQIFCAILLSMSLPILFK
ncbi:hypothetical protein RFI_14177, partial [Reticulomyxa filosa]